MNDNPILYYKNYNMVTELDVSGTFIYEGIKQLNRINVFSVESEIFYFLYNISVGIERLQKVLIVLLEKIDFSNTDEFERNIKTHSHHYLNDRIKQNCKLNFSDKENSFLQILDKFYSDCRYGRFNVLSNINEEVKLVNSYIEKYFSKDTTIQKSVFDSNIINSPKIKDYFGRVIGKIAKKYYDKIYDECHKIGLYTYELRSDSPAEKVFYTMHKSKSLHSQNIDEEIALKEFIVFLMNTKEENSFIRFLRGIEPIDMDPALSNEYLEQICKGIISEDLINEVDTIYDELENKKERLTTFDLIGNTQVLFGYAETMDCYNCIKNFIDNNNSPIEFANDFLKKFELVDDWDALEIFEDTKNICQSFLNSSSYSNIEFYDAIQHEYSNISEYFEF